MLTAEELEQRVIEVAQYMVKKRTTRRKTAQHFAISRMTVHRDLSERLIDIDPSLYRQVKEIISYNISERAIRGGEATRRKYKRNPKGSR